MIIGGIIITMFEHYDNYVTWWEGWCLDYKKAEYVLVKNADYGWYWRSPSMAALLGDK